MLPSLNHYLCLLSFLAYVEVIMGAYNLPAGVKELTGLTEIKEKFKCEADGYFADTDNDCKIYHQCNSFNKKAPNPNKKYAITSHACGEGQIFDQSKLTCKAEDDAIPCSASSDFFYLNDRIGDEKAEFLTDADIEKARNARPEYRAARAKKAKAKKAKAKGKARARARAARAKKAKAKA